MTNEKLTNALAKGFLFGVRVGNNINGNTVDIELGKIKDKVAKIASGHTTIQPSGSELKKQFPGFNDAEAVIRANIDYDQSLAKPILEYIESQDQRIRKS